VRAVAAERRRYEDEQLVDQLALEKRGRERWAALEQKRLHALGGERAQLFLGCARPDLELGAFRQRPATERQAARLTPDVYVSRVEPRVVRADGPHPDRDGVRPGAQLVHQAPRLLTRDPARPGHRHAAVERDGDLVGDERALELRPGQPRLVLAPRVPQVEHFDLDAELPQPPDPVLRRILRPDHHLRHARTGDRVHARRGTAEAHARRERHVERRALRAAPGGAERHDLRVGTSGVLVPALAHDRPLRSRDDRPDDGVRVRRPAPSLGELERTLDQAHANACTKRRYARGRSSREKIALADTSRFAPASYAARMFSSLIPPSTCSCTSAGR
jgi:hypothetical protein